MANDPVCGKPVEVASALNWFPRGDGIVLFCSARCIVVFTGIRVFDVIIAIGLAGLILVPTLRTVLTRGADLVWPDVTACADEPHPSS